MKAKISSAVAVVIALATGPARADTLAYAATGDDLFGMVDLNTGVFTEIGNMGQRLTGLAVGPGGVLYGSGYTGGYNSPTLYSVNQTNGALTVVGNSSIGFYDLGSTTTGLFAEANNGSLYSINPNTAAATLIGPTVLGNGMSTGSNTLYMTAGSTLYTLNTTTGAATLIGSAGSGLFGADIFEGGAIYGGSASPLAIYTLDGTTGAGTLLADVSGTSSNFWGLAPDPLPAATPLPAALPLFATGLGAMGLFGWRRKRKAAALAAAQIGPRHVR